MEHAMQNPEVVLLSDWSHFTSQEMHSISLEANIAML
jgi:hypothetical protein